MIRHCQGERLDQWLAEVQENAVAELRAEILITRFPYQQPFGFIPDRKPNFYCCPLLAVHCPQQGAGSNAEKLLLACNPLKRHWGANKFCVTPARISD
jgi:hypothetical protein